MNFGVMLRIRAIKGGLGTQLKEKLELYLPGIMVGGRMKAVLCLWISFLFFQ